MGFTRLLRSLARDEHVGPRVVPIIPDEARTFGMDALFRELKIYAALGQKYEPVDHDLLLSYTESVRGQILEEGITEAGSMASFIAAATSYAHRGVPMVPFYTFYSMFGFQRVGDLIWQAADARARGFLLGATYGRTTLLGEGLQHQDGHSLVLASTVPAVQAYDPAFAYEVAAIVQAGIHRMFGPDTPPDERDVFYYITLYNENYVMPPMPEGDLQTIAAGIVEGLYRWQAGPDGPNHRATILFSGSAQGAARTAAAELAEHFDVGVDLWSATSYKRLREDALATARWNRLHPEEPARTPRVDRAARRRARARSSPCPTRWPSCPSRSPASCPAGRSARSAPTAWAAATRARRCAASSRSTPATSSSPPSPPSPPRATSSRRRSRDAIKRYDIDPDAANPYIV